jgi:hypothetical protein
MCYDVLIENTVIEILRKCGNDLDSGKDGNKNHKIIYEE